MAGSCTTRGPRSTRGAVLAIGLMIGAGAASDNPARADDAAPPVDKSAFSLFDPTPDQDLRDFSPDRPAKISSPFTVDAGRLQIESDLANFSHTRYLGMTTNTFETLDPTLKLGILNNVDLEMTLNGETLVHQSVDGGGPGMHLSGFGDVFLKSKINLLGDDGGMYSFALIPYVKLPSSTPASLAIGNDAVEAGGIAVLQINLPQDFALSLQSEGDALKGGMDSQRHANFVDIVNLSHPVPGLKELTATAEIFTSISTDRYTPNLYTADVSLAYLIKPSTQLDAGANFGLNAAAPDVQVYCGIAQRF